MKPYALLVNDEPFLRRLVEVILRQAGFRVQTARDGTSALDSIRREAPDLLVLDVMPRVHGLELLRQIRREPVTAETPVIVLSACPHDVALFSDWQGERDLHLTKPFNPRELLAFARRVMERWWLATTPVSSVRSTLAPWRGEAGGVTYSSSGAALRRTRRSLSVRVGGRADRHSPARGSGRA